MTDDELDRLDAACKAATPGPWIVGPEEVTEPYGYDGFGLEIDDGSLFAPNYYGTAFRREDDATFISMAREAMPRLIAELRRLRTLEERS